MGERDAPCHGEAEPLLYGSRSMAFTFLHDPHLVPQGRSRETVGPRMQRALHGCSCGLEASVGVDTEELDCEDLREAESTTSAE
jgi:hypothetical protein